MTRARFRPSVELRSVSRSEGDELALRLVAGPDGGGMSQLKLQQHMTRELRALLGEAAERIATFVVCGVDGDDVASCAAAWGATRVVDLRAPA